MSAEISDASTVGLRYTLENEIRQLKDELRTEISQQAQRNNSRAAELELRLTKWGAQILLMAIAFTLFIAFLTKHERPTTEDAAIVTPRNVE